MRPPQPTARQLTAPGPPHPHRPRRRYARRIALLGALAGATALTACGSGDDATPAPASAATATPTVTAAPAQSASNGTKAEIADFAFSPADTEIQVGDEITWTNRDGAAHTVTGTSGADFDSGTLAQGASFTFKANERGTIAYFCAIHPSMTGTITVR